MRLFSYHMLMNLDFFPKHFQHSKRKISSHPMQQLLLVMAQVLHFRQLTIQAVLLLLAVLQLHPIMAVILLMRHLNLEHQD
uniref:Paramyosin isoform X2 n=1 Tax=Rhizophora mucronata TaxID=61149 RepID=A0A2P2JGI1_RHIMU